MSRWPWLALALSIVACGGDPRAASPGFQVDTLPGGAIRATNGPDGRWSRTGREPWTLQEDLRIGRREGDGPEVFGQVRNVIPGREGTIWILDTQAHELRRFGPDGAFLRTVGGPGEGPGEFGFNPCAFPGPDGEIWVESGGRWQRFGPDGELLGGQPVTRSLGCGILAWRGEEMAAAFAIFDPATRESSFGLILHDRLPDGTVAVRDTILGFDLPGGPTVTWSEGGRAIRTGRLPLAPSPNMFLAASGTFWVTDGGGPYRFRRQTLEGDTLLVVERPYEPVPVPDSVREREIEGLKWGERGYPDGFDRSDLPEVFPPFERIVEADDGTVWLQRRIQDGQTAFDVFRASGEFLGVVPLPPGLSAFFVQRITGEHVYGVARDDLDVPYVVRLGVRK